jgi:tRNA threonylcarbamoyladenosine biosynthesis protein TsaB
MYLAVRTDSATTHLYLLDSDGSEVAHTVWESGRQLSDHLLTKILELLEAHRLAPDQLGGLIVFTGPGSFTGLRIGATVANTVAYVKDLPIVGAHGDAWLAQGLRRLVNGEDDTQVIPQYGAEPNITKPKR